FFASIPLDARGISSVDLFVKLIQHLFLLSVCPSIAFLLVSCHVIFKVKSKVFLYFKNKTIPAFSFFKIRYNTVFSTGSTPWQKKRGEKIWSIESEMSSPGKLPVSNRMGFSCLWTTRHKVLYTYLNFNMAL